MILNEYFDKIFILTIDSNKNRQKECSRLLQIYGIRADFFYGCDGTDLKKYPEYDYDSISADTYLSKLNRSMTDNEIAAAISHRLLYEHCIKNDYKRILILEDDFKIIISDDNYYNQIFNELYTMPWDICYFGKGHHEKNRSYNYISSLKYSHGAFAYALTSSGLSKIMRENGRVINKPADDVLFTMSMNNKLNTWATNADLIMHNDYGISSIGLRPNNVKIALESLTEEESKFMDIHNEVTEYFKANGESSVIPDDRMETHLSFLNKKEYILSRRDFLKEIQKKFKY